MFFSQWSLQLRKASCPFKMCRTFKVCLCPIWYLKNHSASRRWYDKSALAYYWHFWLESPDAVLALQVMAVERSHAEARKVYFGFWIVISEVIFIFVAGMMDSPLFMSRLEDLSHYMLLTRQVLWFKLISVSKLNCLFLFELRWCPTMRK